MPGLQQLPRFDKEESIVVDWASDAKLPPGRWVGRMWGWMERVCTLVCTLECRYLLEDLWHGESLGEVEVGGLSWEGGEWKGILPAHDNWAFKLSPVLL